MPSPPYQIFLSYAADDAFEADLLQYALEHLLADLGATIWTYQRDQSGDERSIGRGLKERVRASVATVFIMSPSTVTSGAAQWMELAYADAYDVPTFVMLHRLTFANVRARRRGIPPLLLERQCTESREWRKIVDELRGRISSLRD